MIGAAVQVLNQKRFKSFLMEMSNSRLLLKVMSNDIIKHLYKKFPIPAKSSQRRSTNTRGESSQSEEDRHMRIVAKKPPI